jgi:hypothetical protein
MFFQFSDTKSLEGFSEEIGKIVEFTPEQTIFSQNFLKFSQKTKTYAEKHSRSLTKFVVFPRKKLGKFWNFLFSSVNSTFFFFGKKSKSFQDHKIEGKQQFSIINS